MADKMEVVQTSRVTINEATLYRTIQLSAVLESKSELLSKGREVQQKGLRWIACGRPYRFAMLC